MSRYQKLMTEILDQIFEGYSFDGGKLKVINESAAKKAAGAVHKLVLEKSRDLWDQLEAAEGSLADVAEEISFEELNADPSSVDMSQGGGVEAAASDDAQAAAAEPTLEGILGSVEDMDFDSIFEMDHLDRMHHTSEPTMMDAEGDDDDVVDGDEDYSDLEIGMDDADMGSSDMEDGMDYDDGAEKDDMDNGDFGDHDSDDMGGMDDHDTDDMGGDDMGDHDMDNGDEMGGFDFDLDLDGDDSEGDDDMDEMMGKPYRMESKGDKDDDDDDDDDKDDEKEEEEEKDED